MVPLTQKVIFLLIPDFAVLGHICTYQKRNKKRIEKRNQEEEVEEREEESEEEREEDVEEEEDEQEEEIRRELSMKRYVCCCIIENMFLIFTDYSLTVYRWMED